MSEMLCESPSGVRGVDFRNLGVWEFRNLAFSEFRNFVVRRRRAPDPPKGVYNALSKKYKN